jgi:hypothetical protein
MLFIVRCDAAQAVAQVDHFRLIRACGVREIGVRLVDVARRAGPRLARDNEDYRELHVRTDR